MLNKQTAQTIVQTIQGNHAYIPSHSIPFITDNAVGYIPVTHLPVYEQRAEFRLNDKLGVLRFAPDVQGFDAKTAAMNAVTDDLIQAGLIKASTEPHFQERAVGGTDRLTNPEFKINRAYFRHYGFSADGVFLMGVIVNPATDDKTIRLQQRSGRVEFAHQYDFIAGGAVKYPQTVNDALQTQIKEETGVKAPESQYIGQTSFMFSTPDKNWVTSLSHHLFLTEMEQIDIGSFDKSEVQGFADFTPAQVIELAANGQFAGQNVQGLMTAMIVADVFPTFEGSSLIVAEVAKHYQPSAPEFTIQPEKQSAPQQKLIP